MSANPQRFLDNAYENHTVVLGTPVTPVARSHITLPAPSASVTNAVSRGERVARGLISKIDTEFVAIRDALIDARDNAFTQDQADALYQTAGDYATNTDLNAVDSRVGTLEGVTHFFQADADALYQPIGSYQPAGDYATNTDLNAVDTRVSAIEGREATYASASDLTSLQGQMNTLLDSGDALDAISELKTAWEAGDSTLQGTLTALTTRHNNEISEILAEIADIKAVLDSQSNP